MNLYGIKHCFNKIISLCAIFITHKSIVHFIFVYMFAIVLGMCESSNTQRVHIIIIIGPFIYKGHIQF